MQVLKTFPGRDVDLVGPKLKVGPLAHVMSRLSRSPVHNLMCPRASDGFTARVAAFCPDTLLDTTIV
jgi:hypothetical protein